MKNNKLAMLDQTLILQKNSPAYFTHLGAAYCGNSLELLTQIPDNTVSLVITSPPFALQRKKEYGNKGQNEYVIGSANLRSWFMTN